MILSQSIASFSQIISCGIGVQQIRLCVSTYMSLRVYDSELGERRKFSHIFSSFVFITCLSIQQNMSAATQIASYDDVKINCSTSLPSTMDCQITQQNISSLNGASLEFRIEQPNYKTAENNEKYFNGKLNCYAWTQDTYRSDVKHFSVDIKEGKLSVQAPKFSDTSYSTAYIRCVGTDIALPANFGVVKVGDGYISEGAETSLRIRAEYKRDNISRQFADSSNGSNNVVRPPIRTHGDDENDAPIPYLPLAKSVSIESSGTIFDAKTGFKLSLKELQHDINRVDVGYHHGFSTTGAVFSSLAPYNTFYESQFGANYVNCTAQVSGKDAFETVLVFDNNFTTGSVEFRTRDPVAHGDWISVDVATSGQDFTVTCPDLTVLNPTELPAAVVISGIGHKGDTDYDYNKQPHLISISSAASVASFAVFSAVTIAATALSMF